MILLHYTIIANCPGFARTVTFFTKLSQDELSSIPESRLQEQQQPVIGLNLQLE